MHYWHNLLSFPHPQINHPQKVKSIPSINNWNLILWVIILKNIERLPWQFNGKTLCFRCGLRVWSLVEKLRSCMLHGAAKKKNKFNNSSSQPQRFWRGVWERENGDTNGLACESYTSALKLIFIRFICVLWLTHSFPISTSRIKFLSP